jgi:tRNA A58 N-methylase Trm61
LLVGENGKVFGVDITPAMVEKARKNVNQAGLSNITVIENLPIESNNVGSGFILTVLRVVIN